MDLREYFESHTGFGVLATAGVEGEVDAAVYARPHVLDDGRVAFVMADRLTRANLLENPHAAYLFREDPKEGGSRHQGVRLFLTRTGESRDPEKIAAVRRRKPGDRDATRYLVTFKVDKVLPLVGSGEEGA